MKKTKLTRSLLAACSIVVLSAVAYGCSSGISQNEADRQAAEAAAAAAEEARMAAEEAARQAAEQAEADRQAAIQDARDAIAAAETAAAAQMAADDVNDIATATEATELQGLVDARIMALDMMAREAEQKMALMNAAGMIDTSDLSTQAAVDAARAAIVMLRGALAAAADVSDADKAMYMSMLDDAVMAVDAAQGGIDTATRRMNQMAALSGASDTLQAALAALAGQAPTQAQIDAASAALAALNMAITDGADLTDAEKATYQREADNAAAPISTAQTSLDDAEETAAEEAARIAAEEAAAAAAAMAVTASKLYAGIGAPNATASDAAQRQAVYSGTDNVDITVTWGADNTAQALTVDDDATVDDLHDWTGMKFTASPDDAGTYEAVVYSHVGEATQGEMFSTTYPYNATPVDTVNTELTIDTTDAAVAGRVASSRFDQSAGIKTFELPENTVRLMFAGSYHGVSGTYYCDPTANTCTVTKVASGFTLTTGTWTFKATNADTRLMDTPDAIYASYGWWLHKSEDDEAYIASAFHGYRDTDAGTVGIAALVGTATYTGGAAGKYALRSSTGGTNDAGHFTADAMLEATFAEDHTISGTINNFKVGDDGEARDWSVALMKSTISDTGDIAGDPDTPGDTAAQMTTWTIGGTASDAAGSWSGTLREQGDDGVPGIATGTFHSTYGPNGNDGNMVGAFGANE